MLVNSSVGTAPMTRTPVPLLRTDRVPHSSDFEGAGLDSTSSTIWGGCPTRRSCVWVSGYQGGRLKRNYGEDHLLLIAFSRCVQRIFKPLGPWQKSTRVPHLDSERRGCPFRPSCRVTPQTCALI